MLNRREFLRGGLSAFALGTLGTNAGLGSSPNSAVAAVVRSVRRIGDPCDNAVPRNPFTPSLGDGRWNSLCRVVLWR